MEIVGNRVEDEMNEIVICKHCGHPEYYGKMRWLNGRCECRQCYRHHYEEVHGEIYRWDDLSGKVPSMMEYDAQEEIKKKRKLISYCHNINKHCENKAKEM